MIRTLEKSHDNILGFSITGEVTDEMVQTMSSRMKDAIAEHGKIRVLARLEDVSPKALITGLKERVSFFADHRDDVERLALVTDNKAAGMFEFASELVSGIDVETFPTTDEEKAWNWVE